MNPVTIALLIGIGLSLITLIGDVFVKKASLQSGFSGIYFLLIGALIYGLTAFGWFEVMKKLKLSTVGVLYSLIIVIGLALISVFYFKEKLSHYELIGIILAFISIILLWRFA